MPELSDIGILSAFVAGIVSFLSPCVLPLVPGYVSYVAGRSTITSPSGEVSMARSAALGFSLCFVLGFTTVFVILGASATALGQLLLRYRFLITCFTYRIHSSHVASLPLAVGIPRNTKDSNTPTSTTPPITTSIYKRGILLKTI